MTDDLNTLLPLSRNVIVKSETLTIEPFLFRDIKKVSGYVAVFRDNMAQGEDGDASLLDIAIQHSEEILEVIGLATGRDAAWCDKLDVASVLELLGAIIEVNLDFFSRLLFPRIKEMVEKIGGGGEVIAGLIEAGHRWADIKSYTVSQVILFDKQVELNKLANRADLVLDLAMASCAEPKKRTEYIKALRKASGG